MQTSCVVTLTGRLSFRDVWTVRLERKRRMSVFKHGNIHSVILLTCSPAPARLSVQYHLISSFLSFFLQYHSDLSSVLNATAVN